MARLIIPTRNRATSLAGVVDYLQTFYPKTRVIIADGSDDHYQSLNKQTVARAKPLDIDYRAFPYDMPFFDRILDVIRNESDDYFVMGSDDDFPVMDVLDEAEAHIRTNSGYSTAMGALVHLKLDSPQSMTARLGVARPILAAKAERRVADFAAWPFSTTYAISTRELLLERYERARDHFLAGFFDFAVGIHDSTMGKIHATPKLGYICTRNYTHSYLRAESDLIFLRRSDLVLKIVSTISMDLQEKAGLDELTAERLSASLIKNRVAELCGVAAHHRRNFENSKWFKDAVVQQQFQLFENLFVKNTNERKSYGLRLEYISAAIASNTASDDNKGERRFYETLDQQQANANKQDTAA